MKYNQRIISLNTPELRNTAKNAIDNLPKDINLEVVIREHKKQRSLDANAKYWAGPLKDIAEQFWLNGRQYSAEILHELFKERYLVDETDEPYIHEHVRNPETYRKYDYTPDGNRVLVGSTTDLTPYGFWQFIEQVYAFGAEHGVLFHANPKNI